MYWRISLFVIFIVACIVFFFCKFSNHEMLTKVSNGPISLVISTLLSSLLLIILVAAWLEFLLSQARQRKSNAQDAIAHYQRVIDLFSFLNKAEKEKGKLYYIADAVDLLAYFAEAFIEQGELFVLEQEFEEANKKFSIVIKEFRSCGKRMRRCVAKAYVMRGVIAQKASRKNEESENKDNSKEEYGEVINTFEEYGEVINIFSEDNDPDVVLAVAQARLNLEALCRRTNYDELYQMKFNCSKFSLLDLLYRKSIHNEKYHDELLKLKALAYWNARQWPDVLKTLDCVKGKDTENTEIDTEIWQLNNFRFWEGRPISLYEVFVNVFVAEGDDNKVFEVIKEIDESVKSQRYGKIKEDLLNTLVDNAYKEIITKFIEKAKQENKHDDCLRVCDSIIKTLNKLEKASLLNERLHSNTWKREVVNIIFLKLKEKADQCKHKKDKDDVIKNCDDWVGKLTSWEWSDACKKRVILSIRAFSVPIYDQLGHDDEVVRRCEDIESHKISALYATFAFFSRCLVSIRRAVIGRESWSNVAQCYRKMCEMKEKEEKVYKQMIDLGYRGKMMRDIANRIGNGEEDYESFVIRKEVFDYRRKHIEENTDYCFKHKQKLKVCEEFCEDCREFIRTFGKVVDDSKIKEGVDKVVLQYAEFICGSSSSLEKQDKRDMLDELKKWCEFPNYQQYIDRLNNN